MGCTDSRSHLPASPFFVRCLAPLLLFATLLSGCGRPGPRHVILLTIDTHRGDHFFSRQAGAETTPRLAALSDRAIRFPHAVSPGNCTSVGTAGILTGLHPHRSTVTTNPHLLPTSLPTLTTLLRSEGFRTAAFVANPVLRPGRGFENGFEVYRWVRAVRPAVKARASAVNREALAWIEGRQPEERMFLWLHYMEPHGPYEPPAELRQGIDLAALGEERLLPLLPEGDNSGLGGVPYYQHSHIKDGPAPRDGREYAARYLAEVLAVDREIAEWIGELERRGILQDAILILAADHGEALIDDHGFSFCHAAGLTEDQVRVPLFLMHPGAAGAVIESPVSTLDVLPTVLSLLELEEPPDLDGFSLLEADRTRSIVSQHALNVALRQGRWKLTRIKNRWRLTDLELDPGETVDLSMARPGELARLQAELRRILELPARAEPRVEAGH